MECVISRITPKMRPWLSSGIFHPMIVIGVLPMSENENGPSRYQRFILWGTDVPTSRGSRQLWATFVTSGATCGWIAFFVAIFFLMR